MLLLIATQLNMLLRSNDSLVFWLGLIPLSFALIALIVTIIRLFRKSYSMQISEFSLHIKNRNLKPEDINEIRVQGYFKPLIGIIPKGKIFTPFDLCFHINPKQEDKAMKELKEWAEQHDVSVKMNKTVRRWI